MNSVEMSPDQIAKFLIDQGFGILSVANKSEPYCVAVSFGYDEANSRCIFNLIMDDSSRKWEYLEDETEATLAVYEYDAPDEWSTVFLQGPLYRLSEEDDTALKAFTMHAASIPFEVLDHLGLDLSPRWYELRVSEQSGMQSSV